MDNTGTYTDNRGTIRDLVQEDIDSVTLVEFKGPYTVRGNHFHKLTTQWNFLIEGGLKYFTPTHPEGIWVSPGDLIKTIPNTPHAFQGKGLLLVMSKGPRRGTNYEDDTYRLAYPLVK